MRFMIVVFLFLTVVIGYFVVDGLKPVKPKSDITIVDNGVQVLGRFCYPPKAVEKVMAEKRKKCSYIDVNKAVWKKFKDEKYDWSPYMVWGDFNNDGTCDYIIRLKNAVGGIDTVAYYRLADSYGEIILESSETPDLGYLIIHKKGSGPDAIESDTVYIENLTEKKLLDCSKIPVYVQEKNKSE